MESIKDQHMSFDEFKSYLKKFIEKTDLLNEAKKDKQKSNEKLQDKAKEIRGKCEEWESEMEK